jgi:hypothetical protein
VAPFSPRGLNCGSVTPDTTISIIYTYTKSI